MSKDQGLFFFFFIIMREAAAVIKCFLLYSTWGVFRFWHTALYREKWASPNVIWAAPQLPGTDPPDTWAQNLIHRSFLSHLSVQRSCARMHVGIYSPAVAVLNAQSDISCSNHSNEGLMVVMLRPGSRPLNHLTSGNSQRRSGIIDGSRCSRPIRAVVFRFRSGTTSVLIAGQLTSYVHAQSNEEHGRAWRLYSCFRWTRHLLLSVLCICTSYRGVVVE